jgi:DNA invertase Pin-like site-specific DNA recombinase
MRSVGYFLEGARRDGSERSVGEQNRAFLDFCTRQGYEIAATFLDTRDGGPADAGFSQLLSFLRRAGRGFTVVVVDGPGTLGPDLGKAAMRLLMIEESGVQVISSQTGGELARELVQTWADRGEGTPVSERVRSAMRRKAVRGEALGRPPYGYRVGARHRLELVPEEAVVVRYIFRLYLQEDMGIRRIAGQLNADGIKTRRGGNWSMVSVRDLLRNRTYLGTYSRFGVKVPDSHPPLASAEDFRRVQERMQSRTSSGRTRTVQPFLLSGLAYCGRCRNRLIGVSRRQTWTTRDGEEKKANYRYYQCESRTNQNACGYNTQRAAELEAAVRQRLAGDQENVSRVHRAGNVDSFILDLIGQADRLEGRMKRVRRQVEELVADAAHGHISIERMRSLGAAHAREQMDLEAELAGTRERIEAQRGEGQRRLRMEAMKESLRSAWETLAFEELRERLREVVDRIEVDGDEMRLFLRP